MDSPENEMVRVMIYAYHSFLGEIRDDVLGIDFEHISGRASFTYYCKVLNEDIRDMADEIDAAFQSNFHAGVIESSYCILVTNAAPDIRQSSSTLLYLKHRS